MTVHTPQRCANTSMAALPTGVNKVVLLDNGSYPAFSNFINDTWTFSGTDWTAISTTQIDPIGPLPGRIDQVMAYDGINVMMYGGRGGQNANGTLNDTWTYNGTSATWAKQAPATSPFGRFRAEAAYLSGTGVVMFGGQNLLFDLSETWVWTGANWVQKFPVASPSARIGHVMAASASLVMMFGGKGTNSQFNDTWTYNGTVWTQLSPATSPSIRSEHCMAYDLSANIWVMFGGQNEYNLLPETWTFDGTTWTQRSIGVGPAGRIGAAMAYDANSGKCVMFGGITATNTADANNETWAFNGGTYTWVQL